jgi:excisionase family DNA binding protein
MNKLLTTAEAAKMLGVGKEKVRMLFDSGKLPGVIIDETPARRTVRYLIEDVEEFITCNRTGSIKTDRSVPTVPKEKWIF